MSRFKSQLDQLRKELKVVYNPATAMSSDKVREILARIEKIEGEMEGKEECQKCSGWGEYECECCGNDRECDDCHGVGLIEKT